MTEKKKEKFTVLQWARILILSCLGLAATLYIELNGTPGQWFEFLKMGMFWICSFFLLQIIQHGLWQLKVTKTIHSWASDRGVYLLSVPFFVFAGFLIHTIIFKFTGIQILEWAFLNR